LELKQYARFLQRWWWLILICSLSAAVIAFVTQLRETPLYASSTTLLVNQSRATREGPSMDDLRTRERLAKTYAELLIKRPVMEAAIADQELDISPGLLASRITIENLPGTELLVMTVRDTDPQRAADLANAIARVFSRVESQLLSDPYTTYRQTLYVVEPAQPRYGPVSPNIPRTVLLALVVGALLATGAGYLLSYFDDRVHSPEDVGRVAGVPTLTSVPPIGGAAPGGLPLLPVRESEPAAEAYRVLRAQVDGTAGAEPVRSLVVTSATPQEGKTTTAINLGIALAQGGMRVVVVDANLRKPAIHAAFQRPAGAGLAGALQADRPGTVVEYLVSTQYDHLYLLPAGLAPANPAGLLAPARVNSLIDELAQHADLIIFDTPALLSVADGALLAGIADATLLVIQAGATREAPLKGAIERLAHSGAHLIGAILNRSAAPAGYAAYYGDGGAQSGVGIDGGRAVIDPAGQPKESPATKAQTR
jgi:capsular exopolysaccharide synthesis family protein